MTDSMSVVVYRLYGPCEQCVNQHFINVESVVIRNRTDIIMECSHSKSCLPILSSYFNKPINDIVMDVRLRCFYRGSRQHSSDNSVLILPPNYKRRITK